MVSHKPETNDEVGIADTECPGHAPELLSVGVIGLPDPPVVGGTGDTERIVDFLRIDIPVEKVAEQRFQLPTILVRSWHSHRVDGSLNSGQLFAPCGMTVLNRHICPISGTLICWSTTCAVLRLVP